MKILLTFILVFCACFTTYAQNVQKPNDDKKLKPIKPRPTDTDENNSVWCSYANGVITIEFEQVEGRATMTITRLDDATSFTTTFYTMTPYSYYIGSAPASYIINIKTSKQEYEGVLEIE